MRFSTRSFPRLMPMLLQSENREDNPMDKFIPYEKLSKKKKRQLDAEKRGSWYGFNPITRKPKNPKAYDRKKARCWRDDSSNVLSSYVEVGAASIQLFCCFEKMPSDLTEAVGFDLCCGRGRLGLQHAPGMLPRALGFESLPCERLFQS